MAWGVHAMMPEFVEWESFYVIVGAAAGALIGLQLVVLTLIASAIAAPSHTHEALLGVGASTLLLHFIGIHNAWDGVAHHVFVIRRKAETDQDGDEKPAKEKS